MIHSPTKLEKQLWQKGLNLVVGLDEVGRGAWAGPLVAAAVVFPKAIRRPSKKLKIFIRDSKSLSQLQRQKAYEWILGQAANHSIGVVSQKMIDRIGIAKANHLAFQKALEQLSIVPDHIISDTFKVSSQVPSSPINHGDRVSFTISAASIVAKVSRDRIMQAYSRQYFNYGFEQHVGYGTRLHSNRLKKYGPCALHRFSFAPVKAVSINDSDGKT